VLEVVDDALAIQEVHGGSEKVPVQRFGEAQAAGLAGHVCDCNDLLEGDDLDGGDDDDEVDVAGAEDPEEAHDHDDGPYCARYEVCLFLFVLGLWWLFWCLQLSASAGDWKRGPAHWRSNGTVLGGAHGLGVVFADFRHAL